MSSKKIVVILVALSLLLMSTFSVFHVSAASHGTISITFDDGWQSQYQYALPLLQATGMKATFYVNTATINTVNYMTVVQLQTLQNYGHEIGSHSNHHIDFPPLSDAQITSELQTSKQTLQSWGLTVNNFAYPDGLRNSHTDSIVLQYYRSARSAFVGPYIMSLPTSQFVLTGFVNTPNSTTLSQLKSMVDQVYSANGWANIVFHDVSPNPGYYVDHTPSADFASFLSYIQAKGVAVVTVNQALSTSSTPTPTPSPSSSPTPSPSSSPTPSPSSSPTPSPSSSPTPSPSSSPTPSPSSSPTPSPSSSPTPSPSSSPTPSPSPSPSPTETPTPQPTSSPDPTDTPIPTPTSTPIPNPIPTDTTTTTITATLSRTPTVTPTPLAKPSPTPTPPVSTLVPTTNSGEIVDLAISGNVTSSQISNASIISSLPSTTTTVAFTLTGPIGSTGFGNMTIPKEAIPYGTNPAVFIDGQAALNQGFTQDADNFYVWYTTEFSTHQMKIQFATPKTSQAPSFDSLFVIAITVPGIILLSSVIAVRRLKTKT